MQWLRPPTPRCRSLVRAAAALAILATAFLAIACAPSMPPTQMGARTGYDRLEESDLWVDDLELAPIFLDPAEVVPADLLEGPHHRVREVRLDHRFLYTYVIETKDGEFEVVGRGQLRERVIEAEALGASQATWLGGTKLYAFEVVNATSEPIEDTLQILRHPVRTVTNVPRGMKASFLALHEMKELGRTYLEDDYYKEFIGLSEKKREWAERMGVDPYSTNPYLQARLSRNGWLSLAGDMTVTLATIPVPAGAAAIVMSVVGATSSMNEQLHDVAPEDVRVTSRSWLRSELAVDEELADLFLTHPWYSPSLQDTIVRALSRMHGAAHRDRFLELATRADAPHEAYAFSRLALMLAESHERRSPISEVFVAHDLVMARTADGEVILPLYVDHGYWTAEVAQAESEIVASLGYASRPEGPLLLASGEGSTWAHSEMAERPPEKRLLLVSGAVSTWAHAEMAGRGWEVIEGLEDLWLTPLDLARLQPADPDSSRFIPEFGHR